MAVYTCHNSCNISCYTPGQYYVRPGNDIGSGSTAGSYTIPAGSIITTEAIVKRFLSVVKDAVFTSNMVHLGYIPTSPYTGKQVVPRKYLGSKSNFKDPIVGSSGSIITASTIYNALVAATRWLLRVGTYSYSESCSVTGKWPGGAPSSCPWSSSGRALFSDSYASSGSQNPNKLGNLNTTPLNPIPNEGGVLTTRIISVESINTLVANCLNSWNNTDKPRYNENYHYCHSSCHNNCHSNCHGNSSSGGGGGCYWAVSDYDNCGPHDGCHTDGSRT